MQSLDKIRILIVEDDADLRDVIVEGLGIRGASALGVENGRLALALLKKQTFDVVLSDIRMPGGDGIELIKNIRGLSAKPKLFLYTGFTDLSDLEAKAIGVIRVLSKPIEMSELIRVIAESMK